MTIVAHHFAKTDKTLNPIERKIQNEPARVQQHEAKDTKGDTVAEQSDNNERNKCCRKANSTTTNGSCSRRAFSKIVELNVKTLL